MAKKMRDDRSRVVIRVPAGVGQAVQQSTKRRSYGTDGFRNRETIAGTFCNSCRKAMLERAQIGGVCLSCGLAVCAECASTRCSICNACACDNSACSSVLRGKKVCNAHGFGAYLKFAFTLSR